MDKIHDPDGRPWISAHSTPGDYFKEFSELVENEKPLRDLRDLRPKWTMKHMGLEDKELFDKVEEVMNIDNLTMADEVEAMQINDPIGDTIPGVSTPKFYRTPITPEASESLETLSNQQKYLEVSRGGPTAKQRRKRQSRHDNDHWFLAETPEAEHKNWDLTDSAVIYCVRIYRPIQHLVPGQSVLPAIRYQSFTYNKKTFEAPFYFGTYHFLLGKWSCFDKLKSKV